MPGIPFQGLAADGSLLHPFVTASIGSVGVTQNEQSHNDHSY